MYSGAFGMFGTNPMAGANDYAYVPTMANTQVWLEIEFFGTLGDPLLFGWYSMLLDMWGDWYYLHLLVAPLGGHIWTFGGADNECQDQWHVKYESRFTCICRVFYATFWFMQMVKVWLFWGSCCFSSLCCLLACYCRSLTWISRHLASLSWLLQPLRSWFRFVTPRF